MIGYRIVFKKYVKYYREDATVKICTIKGNKRTKPDRIWKFGHRYYSSLKISKKRLEELKDEIRWFEEN